MNTKPLKLLQLPPGASRMLLHSSRLQHQLANRLNALYDRWGYTPVHTPLVDYAKSYEGLNPAADSSHIYHLVDRDGEILMLRWDITQFLIKQVRSLLPEARLPLRLSYADSILRHQDAEDIGRNEFFQTGVELIGREGPEGELEILLLFHEACTALGIKAAVHLGSHSLFNAAVSAAKLNADDRDQLAQSITSRDFNQVQDLVGPDLAQLFSTIHPAASAPQAFADLIGRLPDPVAKELTALLTTAASLCALAPDCDLRLDCSELGSRGYHSGIVFQAYADGVDSAIAAGGRYDELLRRLAVPRPALGFSIMLSKILPILQATSEEDADLIELSPPEGDHTPEGDNTPRQDFAQRFAKAHVLRSQGKRVAL